MSTPFRIRRRIHWRTMTITLSFLLLVSSVAWAHPRDATHPHDVYLPLIQRGGATTPPTATPTPTSTVPPTPTSTPVVTETVGVVGEVLVRPQAVHITGRQPIAYHVVLDVTGSMSWDFAGYGTVADTDYQCESPDNPNPRDLPYHDACQDGATSGWRVIEERRISIVKQALHELRADMETHDRMRIVAYTKGNATIGADNVRTYPATGMTGDQETLVQAIHDAGAWGHGPYTTIGGNANAQAFHTTRHLLAEAPDQAPDGRRYRDVVVYITDGVANVFLDGTTNTARDVCGAMSVAEALRTVDPCHMGRTADGTPRPMDTVMREGFLMRDADPDLDVYVIAIGPADDDGLPEVAGQAEMLYTLDDPDLVDDALQEVAAQSRASRCQVTAGAFTAAIAGHEAGSLPGFPVPANGHGYVTIHDKWRPGQPVTSIRLPVVVDSVHGTLRYQLPVERGLAPGEYTLEAYVNYRGDDGLARTYRWFETAMNPDAPAAFRFHIPPDPIEDVHHMEPVLLDLPPEAPLCPASSRE